MRRRIVPITVALLLALCALDQARAASDTSAAAASQSEEASADSAQPSITKPTAPPVPVAKDKDWVATLLNVLAIAFLVWLAGLMWKPGVGRDLSEESDSQSP